jgi:uncharacterized membrane protein
MCANKSVDQLESLKRHRIKIRFAKTGVGFGSIIAIVFIILGFTLNLPLWLIFVFVLGIVLLFVCSTAFGYWLYSKINN